MIRSDKPQKTSKWRDVPRGFRINWGQAGDDLAILLRERDRLSKGNASRFSAVVFVCAAVLIALYWSFSDLIKRPRLGREAVYRLPPPIEKVEEVDRVSLDDPDKMPEDQIITAETALNSSDTTVKEHEVPCCANDDTPSIWDKNAGVTHTTFIKVADLTWIQVQSCALEPKYLKCA